MAAANKKVGPVLPENRQKKTDSTKENKTGSEYISMREQMIQGYQEMADINLKLSEEFYAAEQELWFKN